MLAMYKIVFIFIYVVVKSQKGGRDVMKLHGNRVEPFFSNPKDMRTQKHRLMVQRTSEHLSE